MGAVDFRSQRLHALHRLPEVPVMVGGQYAGCLLRGPAGPERAMLWYADDALAAVIRGRGRGIAGGWRDREDAKRAVRLLLEGPDLRRAEDGPTGDQQEIDMTKMDLEHPSYGKGRAPADTTGPVWWRHTPEDPVYRAETRTEALEDMRQFEREIAAENDETALRVEGMCEASSDCWLVWPREPEPSDWDLVHLIEDAEVEFDDLIIREPGQHPGGHAWWIDLPGPIFEPVYAPAVDHGGE